VSAGVPAVGGGMGCLSSLGPESGMRGAPEVPLLQRVMHLEHLTTLRAGRPLKISLMAPFHSQKTET
jgi:hypothetical protein